MSDTSSPGAGGRCSAAKASESLRHDGRAQLDPSSLPTYDQIAGWRRDIRDRQANGYAAHVRWLDPDTKTSTGSESATRNAAETAQAVPEKPEPVVPPRCSSCKQPFWAGRTSELTIDLPDDGGIEDYCGDCISVGYSSPNAAKEDLTNDLDTRIAEVAEPEVRIEDMPGAWQSSSWEDVS